MKRSSSRQSANTSHLAAFADLRHSRIFCGDFSLLIFTQILITIARLESLWWLRINTCGLTRREWDETPRALWGTQDLHFQSATPHLVSDVVFSSFYPKSLMGDKSRGEMPGTAGTRRAVREPGCGDNQPVGLWWSWTDSCIRERRPWRSGCPPWPSARPWTPARRGCHSREGTAGCHQRAASHGWPCTQTGWHCMSCKVTPGLVWHREAWLVLRRNCWQLGGHWVPERKRKNVSKRVRHGGSAVKEAVLRCCPQRLCTRPGDRNAHGTPREPPIITTPHFRGTVTPLCFAFKTSYPAPAGHTSPSSLSQPVSCRRGLGKTHQEQGRNGQAPPYAGPPSHKQLSRDSLVASNQYVWELLLEVLVMSLSHLSRWAPPLGNESHRLEQVGCNIDPPFPNFTWGVGHRGEALAGSAGCAVTTATPAAGETSPSQRLTCPSPERGWAQPWAAAGRCRHGAWSNAPRRSGEVTSSWGVGNILNSLVTVCSERESELQ